MRISKARVLANKQYISIIRLFNHCAIAFGDDFNLSRIKKQLQAEFRVARDGLIEVDGYTYTQHEVFEEIENVNFPKRLTFHKQIWDSPQLLLLLEKNTADLSTIGEAFKPFWSNKEFDVFFSPYFVGPFNYLSRTLLAELNLKEMGDLLCYEDFLQPTEREEAFRSLRIFLDENIRILRNVNAENYKIIRPKISHWIDNDWFVFFNNLPYEFYDLKIEIVTRLINIGVDVQKSQRRDCRQMSFQLASLQDIPQDLNNTILTNHEIYTRPRGITGLGEGWWAVIGLFLLIRVFTCNARDDKSNNSQYPFEFKYQLPDSILYKTKDSQFIIHSDSLLKLKTIR